MRIPKKAARQLSLFGVSGAASSRPLRGALGARNVRRVGSQGVLSGMGSNARRARIPRSALKGAPIRRQAQNAPSAAMTGKWASRAVIGAAVGLPVMGALKNSTGRAADRPMGRPTGPYMY